MSDKTGVNIKIKADSKDAEKNIKKVSTQLSGMAKMSVGFNAVTAAAQTLSGAFSKVSAAVGECMDLYEKQAAAEVQLEAAAKNNPYLNSASVVRLKDYASQLQSISTFGDEELIPMMARLAASGRTQAEIQDIMSASVDIAASGAMSLESAVKNLDKTYSGLSGELGETNPAIKALTAEQLKNGDAVRIMKSQYSGMAESVAGATGGWKQFKNTLGDLKESIGKNFSETRNSAGKVLNSFLSKIVSGLTSASKEAENFKSKIELIAQNDSSGASKSSIQTEIDTLEESSAELRKIYRAKTLTQKEYIKDTQDNYDKFASDYRAKNAELNRTQLALERSVREAESADDKAYALKKLSDLKNERAVFAQTHSAELKSWESALDDAKKEYEQYRADITHTAKTSGDEIAANDRRIAELRKKASVLPAESGNGADKRAADAQAKYAETMAKFDEAQKKQRIEAKATGETLDELSMAMARLSAQSEAYAQARIDAGASMSDSNPWVKARKNEISASQDLCVQLTEEQDYWENLQAALDSDFDFDGMDTAWGRLSERMKELGENTELPADKIRELAAAAIDEAETQLALLSPQSEAYRLLAEQIGKAKDALKGLGESSSETWGSMTSLERAEFVVSQMASLSQGVISAMSTASDAMANQADADLTRLETAYKKGEVSEEEYYERKEKIEKEAARKKYKTQLAEWALNLLMTQSEQALAIAKALSSSAPPLSYITAAITGAAAAAQLAAQIAAKPVPPSFASGGIVQGNSYSGDKVSANVNSGEMILNARQQRQLWETANGGGGAGGVSLNVNVENSASDVAQASVIPGADGFTVAIKRIVGDAMASGELNDSYQTMRAGIYGRRITS